VLPSDYVPNENQRITLYRRLAGVEEPSQLKALVKEMRDRFGPMPEPLKNLIRIVQIKLLCMEVGVQDVAYANGRLTVSLTEESQLTAREQRVYHGVYTPTLRQARQGVRASLPRATFTARQISFAYNRADAADLPRQLTELLGRLRHREGAVRPPMTGAKTAGGSRKQPRPASPVKH